MNLTFKQFLLEDRVDFLAANMGHKLIAAAHNDHSANDLKSPADIVSELKKADPTPNHASLQFLVNMYVTGQFKMEDINKIKHELILFYDVRKHLTNKDLINYKTLDSLYDATEPLATVPVEPSKREEKKNIKEEGATPIVTSDVFKAVMVTTAEAAKIYGANTKWCTTNKGTCDNYLKKGPLFVIMVKKPKENRWSKFQLHAGTDQFMDERDRPISQVTIKMLSKFPEYTKFMNYVINHHYAEFIEK